jgi:FAD/FMN-containing dehydrogenase
VTPGTQFVTLGGMVAADVHGKNHHVAGSIGEHVRALRLRVADGRILEVSRDHELELFRATLGGMGLTGHILEVELTLTRIDSPWIWGEVERARDLDELVAKQREASRDWPYTVSWVDCLARGGAMGRGVVHKGRWALPGEAPSRRPRLRPLLPVPMMLPEWALSPASCRLLNTGYYHNPFLPLTAGVRHPQSFFYPLDVLHEWHRIYGRSGMSQYQCVLPVEEDTTVVRRFFEALSRSQVPSFLSVVKDCGPEGTGLLSFPRPGISVALDLPIRGSGAAETVGRLNEIVIEAGGRIYLAKDALTTPEHFRAMETRLDAFNDVRRRWDPEGRLKSALSIRLLGDQP